MSFVDALVKLVNSYVNDGGFNLDDVVADSVKENQEQPADTQGPNVEQAPVVQPAEQENPDDENEKHTVSNLESFSATNTTPVASSDTASTESSDVSQPTSIIVDQSKPSLSERLMHDRDVEQIRNRTLKPQIDRMVDEARESSDNYIGSQQQLDDLQRRFQEDQEKNLVNARSTAEDQLWGQYAAMGVDPSTDSTYQQRSDSIKTMDSVPSTLADASRRMADENGNLRANPLEWNLFGVNSQTKTPDSARHLYDFLFDKEDADNTRGNETMSAWDGGGNSISRSSWRNSQVNPLTGQPLVDPDLIDDGMSRESRESAFMTGRQYLKYRNEIGIPGREVDDIDPNAIYSKQDEMERYGFVPYLTTDEAVDRFHETTAPHTGANYFNDLADFRRNATDHKINYEGQEYSGGDFDKNVRQWAQKTQGKKAEHPLTDNPGEFDIPQAMVMYDTQGNRFVAPNEPVSAEKREDGSIVFKFNDNPDDDWVFDNEDDLKKSSRWENAQDGDTVLKWETNWEPLKLDSGQKIRADKALDIVDKYNEYADYGWGNIAKPNPDGILENPSDFLPWFTDMVLSSSPYFDTRTAGIKGVADTFSSAQGMRPGRQNESGTYNLVSENPDFNDVASATVGSAIMPVTEHLWGPLGEHLFNGPTRFVLDKTIGRALPNGTGRGLDSTPGRWLTGTSDEGVEEIFGNIVEELINNGALDWYADDVVKRDDNGNVMLDDRGKPMVERDNQNRVLKQDTDLTTRLRNFLADAPEAYAGGAMLGGILGAGRIPQYKNEILEQLEKENSNKQTEVDVDQLLKTSSLSDMDRRRADYRR